MARLAATARPIDGERIARGALEAAVLLANVGEGVVERPVVALAECLRRDPDAQLRAAALQVTPQLADAIEQLTDARIAPPDLLHARLQLLRCRARELVRAVSQWSAVHADHLR